MSMLMKPLPRNTAAEIAERRRNGWLPMAVKTKAKLETAKGFVLPANTVWFVRVSTSASRKTPGTFCYLPPPTGRRYGGFHGRVCRVGLATQVRVRDRVVNGKAETGEQSA